METKISELTRSLEFSQAEVGDLLCEIKALRKAERGYINEIETLKTRVEDLEQRTNYQEDYSRRNNLRISGIRELPNGETWEQTAEKVSALLKDKLKDKLKDMKLERAHRVGQPGHFAPRTIVARFKHFSDREAAMRNARKLKGSGIYFNEDLCPASQEIIKKQLPLLKQARADGKIAYFKYTKLIIKERENRIHPTGTDGTSNSCNGTSTSASVPGGGATTGVFASLNQVAGPDAVTAAATVGGGGLARDDGRAGPSTSTSVGPSPGGAVGSGDGVVEGDVSEGEAAAEASGNTTQQKPKGNIRPRRKNNR